MIDVGKDIWKKLKPPEKLVTATGQDGISGNTYYSGQYRFAISIPDDSWQFWEPSPQFVSSFGVVFAMPTRAMPIVVLSKQMVKLFRPNVNIIIEDVGSFTNIDEIANAAVQIIISTDQKINANDIHVSNKTNSAALIASQPYFQATLYHALQIYLYGSRTYTVTASYVPVSDDSPMLFGGLQDVMNSFQLIQL